jgi:hypothetical protein
MNSDPDLATGGGDEPDEESFVATPDDTRQAIVRRTGRGYTPVRHVFVQKHDGPQRASTLARFCRNRKKRALVLYLLLLTMWKPEASPYRSEFWLRALDVADGNVTWSKSSLSTSWTSLVDMGLAARTRTRRMAKLVARREDGEEEYSLPDGKRIPDRYFVLPGEFWTEKWFDELSLPAICVLLVLLKETNDQEEIHLTYEQFDTWYGISASSAQKGLGELEDAGLVSVRPHRLKAAFSAKGFTLHLYYRLNGAFSTDARKAARGEAANAARGRAGAAEGSAQKSRSKTKKSTAKKTTAKKTTAKKTTAKKTTAKKTTAKKTAATRSIARKTTRRATPRTPAGE